MSNASTGIPPQGEALGLLLVAVPPCGEAAFKTAAPAPVPPQGEANRAAVGCSATLRRGRIRGGCAAHGGEALGLQFLVPPRGEAGFSRLAAIMTESWDGSRV